jgi:hypothetical protein
MAENQAMEILKIKKITLKGFEIEASYITSITIFESITQPGITGLITIQDYQGFREVGNIFAGDELTLSFCVEGLEGDTLELKMVIYTDEGSKVLPQNTYDVLQLGFCSKWLIDALTKCVSKPYKDMYIHEIIKDILETECIGAEIGYIEPMEQKLEHFLSPRWTPYHTIKYLLSFAINKEKIGGYICWTDLKTSKINITTIDYLMKGTLGITDNSFIVLSGNKRYQGRIKHLDFEGSYDTFRMVNNGMQQSIYYGFNYDKKKFVTTKEKVTEIKNKRLSTKLPIESKYKDDPKYAKYYFSPLFPSTDTSIASDDTKIENMIKGSLYNHYAFLTTDIFKVNIETLGDTKRRVGQLALLEYPSQDEKSTGNDGNKQLKTEYLIREMRHIFSPYEDYKQYITLVIDGYKEHSAEIIKW